MLQHDLSKESVLHFAEKLMKLVTYDNENDRNLIKKGLMLYRQGSVYNVKQSEQTISGKIQDVTPVSVTLDLDFLEMSSCSCPSPDFCRHRMALFFYVFASVDRVGALLDEWKSQLIPVKTAASILKKNHVQKPYNDDSVASWISFFEKEYTEFLKRHPEPNYYFISTVYHRYYQSIINHAPKTAELTKLFRIHAAIYSIDKIIELVDEHSIKNYQFDSYVKPYVHNLVDSVIDHSHQLGTISMPFSMDELLEESMELVREILLKDEIFSFERFLMYRLLWFTLFNRKKWIQQEQSLVRNEYASAHLHFLQDDDDSAISILEKIGPNSVPYSFWWVNVLTDAKKWNRVSIWNEFLINHIHPFIYSLRSFESRRHMTKLYLQTIVDFAEAHDDSNYVDAMKAVLPYSFVEYEHYLFDTESYKEWIELHLMAGYDIDECDRHALKIIEQNERESLLPLYHQAVTKAIEGKNRQSYKKAIKYLKKLRMIYRKLKKEDVWDMYIKRVAHVNKRLRAFQEELQRANLVKS